MERLCGCGGMVDALVLGTSGLGRGGSSPLTRTIRLRLRFGAMRRRVREADAAP